MLLHYDVVMGLPLNKRTIIMMLLTIDLAIVQAAAIYGGLSIVQLDVKTNKLIAQLAVF